MCESQSEKAYLREDEKRVGFLPNLQELCPVTKLPCEAVAQVSYCTGKSTMKKISWILLLFRSLQNMVKWTVGGTFHD